MRSLKGYFLTAMMSVLTGAILTKHLFYPIVRYTQKKIKKMYNKNFK